MADFNWGNSLTEDDLKSLRQYLKTSETQNYTQRNQEPYNGMWDFLEGNRLGDRQDIFKGNYSYWNPTGEGGMGNPIWEESSSALKNAQDAINSLVERDYGDIMSTIVNPPATPTTRFGNLDITGVSQGDPYGNVKAPTAKVSTNAGEMYYLPSDVLKEGAANWMGEILYPALNKESLGMLKSLKPITAPEGWGETATGAYGKGVRYSGVDNLNSGYFLTPEQYKKVIVDNYTSAPVNNLGARLNLSTDQQGNPLYYAKKGHGDGDFFTYSKSPDPKTNYSYNVGDYATPPAGNLFANSDNLIGLAPIAIGALMSPLTMGMSLAPAMAIGAGTSMASGVLMNALRGGEITPESLLKSGLMGGASAGIGNFAGGFFGGAEGLQGLEGLEGIDLSDFDPSDLAEIGIGIGDNGMAYSIGSNPELMDLYPTETGFNGSIYDKDFLTTLANKSMASIGKKGAEMLINEMFGTPSSSDPTSKLRAINKANNQTNTETSGGYGAGNTQASNDMSNLGMFLNLRNTFNQEV